MLYSLSCRGALPVSASVHQCGAGSLLLPGSAVDRSAVLLLLIPVGALLPLLLRPPMMLLPLRRLPQLQPVLVLLLILPLPLLLPPDLRPQLLLLLLLPLLLLPQLTPPQCIQHLLPVRTDGQLAPAQLQTMPGIHTQRQVVSGNERQTSRQEARRI